jgi:septal ring factor EnvC (AmiA/AmiB activator)
LADAAQWKTTENVLLSRAAGVEAKILARERYGAALLSSPSSSLTVEESAHALILPQVSRLTASSQALAEDAQKEELALRTEEMHWQTEEQTRSLEADRLRQNQEAQRLKWKSALDRKTALEDEISQIDQSAKALQVMLQDMREHRDQARALRENRQSGEQSIASLRGTLPWPAQGKVVQGFGRQYPDGLNQLVVSNGIKIDSGPRRVVRVIQEGKVLFANPFRQYGQLVIVQHKNGLTSVYAGLGETQVKEGQELAALDALGVTAEAGSFYFELRHDEQPVNPLAYLSPAPSSELSSRRTFR